MNDQGYYYAHIDTPSFNFSALGLTEDEALDALMYAWHLHARESGALPGYVDRDDIRVDHVLLGHSYRDGEQIYSPKKDFDELACMVAGLFSRKVVDALGEEKAREVDLLNGDNPEPGVCYSHNYCDPNVYMAEALKTFRGRDLGANTEDPLWNRAWEIATQNGFCYCATVFSMEQYAD